MNHDPHPSKPFYEQKIGVVGGGQLGKMLAMAGAPLSLNITVLDKEEHSSAKGYTHGHVIGDPLNDEDIINMGKDMNVVTIEMENVSVQALKSLRDMGKIVCPSPENLEIIQDKGLQKQFYADHNIPTSKFVVYEDLKSLMSDVLFEGDVSDGSEKTWNFPFVVKSCRAGYDGKGVYIIKNKVDLEQLEEDRYLIEGKVDLKMELSVIVARNGDGESKAYPINQLHTHAEANLLSHMTCPADLDEHLSQKAQALAIDVVEAYALQGLLAVEIFVDQNHELWINEVSPRPHNTGHHTIEAFMTSQYEQHLRAILNLPLGSTKMLKPSALLNVLGPSNLTGKPIYEGLENLLKMEGVHPHLYGKKLTKPHRKLGHVTILADDVSKLDEKVKNVQKTLQVKI
jgi:5-(carboxyamino)imidazole ribonucleotide synthase